MKIDAITVPGDGKNKTRITRDVTVVVIDVLRVCTTIVTAMDSGTRRIFPALTVKEAFQQAERLRDAGEDVLLCGERGGTRVEGFDMGNSPREYTPDAVGGKTLVMSSTNGTGAMKRSAGAAKVLVGSILNGQAVSDWLIGEGGDVVFYLSGREGDFSYEDAAGAGFIINGVMAGRQDTELTDSALMCLDLYRGLKEDLAGMFRRTYHGRYLESIGFGQDLDFCARRGVSHRIPQVEADGFIRS